MTFFLLIFLVCCFPVLDLAVAALYAATDSPDVGGLRLLRDGSAILLFGLAIVRGAVPTAIKPWVALYLGLILLYLVAAISGGEDRRLAIASAGQLTLPIVLLYAGLAGVRNGVQLSRMLNCLVALALASALFGVWERNHTEWWTDVVFLGDYLRDIKGVALGVAYHDLPFNFYGYDGDRRAAGLLAAPLAQGSFLAVVGLVALAWYRSTSPLLAYGLMAACAVGVYQSGTRGALTMLLAAVAVYGLLSAAAGRLRAMDWLAFGAGCLVAARPLYRILLYTVQMGDGSTDGHVASLAANLEEIGSVVLVGQGLGGAGALAAQAGLDIAGGGEGALFSIAYQIGVPGGVAFMGFYLAAVLQLFLRHRLPGRLGDLARAAFALMIGAMATLVTSEHLLTFSGMAALWLVAGGILAAPAAAALRPNAESPPQGRLARA